MLSKSSISYFIILWSMLICSLGSQAGLRDTLDISGKWTYHLLGAPASIPGEGELILPGTLDEQHKSEYNPKSTNTSQLRREFSFVGEAQYSRMIDIPRDWAGKDIMLLLERTKPSSLKIDGEEVGYNSVISSPQKYNLSHFLTPGRHKLEITVNNADSIPPIVARSSNAVSDATQTNWNGILGEMLLEAKNPLHIKNITFDDSNVPDDILINLTFSKRIPTGFSLSYGMDGKKPHQIKIPAGIKDFSVKLPIKKEELWSASNPVIHNLEFLVRDSKNTIIDRMEISAGFRKLTTSGKNFLINGYPVFLRGTVNAAVFPLTGYAPIDEESWINYFNVLKNYGINHVRFHSWTPPEAAFRAADITGLYLLVELPIWGELDRDLKFHNRFLKEELKGIMETYANHPSFMLFSTGNELWGDISLMAEYMNEARQLNPRILATHGSNVYLGMNGELGGEDFLITAKTNDEISNSVRGSVSFADSPTGGHFNSSYPDSKFNFSKATANISVPVISHEAGQYQSYPDFTEIERYTGNLKPDNLEEFKNRAIEAGTYRKSDKYKLASGKWASKLYKAEMELALRSPGIAGIHLFGLQDYPGQGTATIGILNNFMETKGFISPDEFRQVSADVAILAEWPKFSFTSGETVEIPLLTVNFTENPDTISAIIWNTGFDKGNIEVIPGTGVIENEAIYLKIPSVSVPQKMKMELSSSDTPHTNSYDFWVYPKTSSEPEDINVTDNLTEALILLDQGARVLLTPDSATIANASLDPLFTTDFWNYRMFRTICDEMNLKPSPGTLGLYIDKDHPALKKFPTDIHTDWQWYPVVANSRPLIIDRLPKDFDPIVEVIDNVERNFRLALLMECNVGKGMLMILPLNIKEASKYPEGKWFLQSVKEYMSSKDFRPAVTLTPDQVVNMLTKPSNARLIKQLKNETYDSNWD